VSVSWVCLFEFYPVGRGGISRAWGKACQTWWGGWRWGGERRGDQGGGL